MNFKSKNHLRTDRIDRTALASASEVTGHFCVNMKEFMRTIDVNPRQNMETLFDLVQSNSDSIIGFVELNGLSYVNSWLTRAFNSNRYSFTCLILQFLAHPNLDIWYAALHTSKIGKTINVMISSFCDNGDKDFEEIHQMNAKSRAQTKGIPKKSQSPKNAPQLTNEIKSLLPDEYLNLLTEISNSKHKKSKKNISNNNNSISTNSSNNTKKPQLNCNTLNQFISPQFLQDVCHNDTRSNETAMQCIIYLQYQYARAIMNKWRNVIEHWKKTKDTRHYRKVKFTDERGKPLCYNTLFCKTDYPITISKAADTMRRCNLPCDMEWHQPKPLHNDLVDLNLPAGGSESKAKKTARDRESNELQVFFFPPNPLPNPKDLKTNVQSVKVSYKNYKKMIKKIALEAPRSNTPPTEPTKPVAPVHHRNARQSMAMPPPTRNRYPVPPMAMGYPPKYNHANIPVPTMHPPATMMPNHLPNGHMVPYANAPHHPPFYHPSHPSHPGSQPMMGHPPYNQYIPRHGPGPHVAPNQNQNLNYSNQYPPYPPPTMPPGQGHAMHQPGQQINRADPNFQAIPNVNSTANANANRVRMGKRKSRFDDKPGNSNAHLLKRFRTNDAPVENFNLNTNQKFQFNNPLNQAVQYNHAKGGAAATKQYNNNRRGRREWKSQANQDGVCLFDSRPGGCYRMYECPYKHPVADQQGQGAKNKNYNLNKYNNNNTMRNSNFNRHTRR